MVSSWKCEFCKTVNYNQEYIKLYAKNIDFSKTHNLLQVGMASYEGQDYQKALDIFEKILFENSACQDAWVYAALCTAYLADLSNLEKSAKKADSYLAKARELNPDSVLVSVGNSVTRNVLGKALLKAIKRSCEMAEKNYFAYESIDKSHAIKKRSQELEIAYLYATYALDNPPDDPEISGPIAVEILRSVDAGICPIHLKNKSENILNHIKTVNISYYEQLQLQLRSSKSKTGYSSFIGSSVKCLVIGIIVYIVLQTLIILFAIFDGFD